MAHQFELFADSDYNTPLATYIQLKGAREGKAVLEARGLVIRIIRVKDGKEFKLVQPAPSGAFWFHLCSGNLGGGGLRPEKRECHENHHRFHHHPERGELRN